MATGYPHKLALISSTKEWPQIDDNNFVMEKPTQDHQQQQHQQTLKCPRCDSSNTKFCYYNNYSLSQPRHFCKACKRYWTRGGTLRNVPVGGGCRKNKKVKRPPSISAVDSSSPSSSVLLPTTTASAPNPNIVVQHQMNPPLFYGLPTYPTMINSRVSNVDTVSGYDLQPQMNALALGFSSGFNTTNSNSLFSSYPIFGSSSLQQQKYVSANSFLGLAPNYEEEMQMQGMKEVKMEETQKRLDLFNVPNNFQNQIEQMGSSSDPSLLWMLDPANIGSSVPSLI